MTDEVTDAGLDELTSDILGPVADDPAESESANIEQTVEESQEQTETQPTQAASVPTPTPPVAPEQTVEIEGRTYTREQLKAALTTREQFPHLQKKYTDLLEESRARQAQSQQQQAPQGKPIDPAQVVAQIRTSFDGAVKKSVEEGFIEEDFTILYPNLAASMVMNRDALTAVATIVQRQAEKISQYEQQIEAEQTRAEIDNNMVALSGQHEAFKPLQDPATRKQFLGYLIHLNPPVSMLNDPEFMVSQWVAYNKNTYLNGIDAARQRSEAVVKQRGVQRRQAQGDALPGSRPSQAPAAPTTPLDELVDDFFAFKA